MARNEDFIAKEDMAGVDNIREGSCFFNVGAVEVVLDVKGEAPLWRVLEKTFVEGALVVHNEFGLTLEESGEIMEWIRRGRRGRDCSTVV